MDKLKEILEGANIATLKLNRLSDAFYLTGNIEMSNTLSNIADLICDIPKDINSLNHHENMEIINEGNKQLGKILTTIMDKGES